MFEIRSTDMHGYARNLISQLYSKEALQGDIENRSFDKFCIIEGFLLVNDIPRLAKIFKPSH